MSLTDRDDWVFFPEITDEDAKWLDEDPRPIRPESPHHVDPDEWSGNLADYERQFDHELDDRRNGLWENARVTETDDEVLFWCLDADVVAGSKPTIRAAAEHVVSLDAEEVL